MSHPNPRLAKAQGAEDAAQEATRQELLSLLLGLDFHAFEHCIQDLLTALGYTNAQVLDRKHRKGRNANGGVDLEAIAKVGVTSVPAVIRLKQFTRPVQKRFIDELRGVMVRIGVTHGLVVTTATFPTVSREAAKNALAPIRLIDGDQLIDLLIEHGIGIRGVEDDWQPDHDYFAALNERFSRQSLVRKPSSIAGQMRVNSTKQITSYEGGSMTWRTHMLAGIGALWAVNIVPGGITADNLGALCLFASFGALLPDLDASQSKIRSLSLARIQPFEPIGFVAHRFFGHRGLLHSPAGLAVAGILAGTAASRIGWEASLASFLGYGSHLALDACTKSGIPLFPGRAWRLHLLPKSLRIATGSAAEDLVLVALLIVVLALILPYLVSYHS